MTTAAHVCACVAYSFKVVLLSFGVLVVFAERLGFFSQVFTDCFGFVLLLEGTVGLLQENTFTSPVPHRGCS